MRKINRAYPLIVLAILAACAAPKQAARTSEPAQPNPLDQIIPLNPKVRKGTLANGMRYVIRQNQKPEKRASLRLVVDVGSVQEDDDQQGLAHFVEHMLFNGTEKYPKQDIPSLRQP